MAQNNCTTLFPNVTTQHQDKFFFRVENGAFKATASCQAIQVNVRDSWSPIITVSGAQTETQVVTVTCSAVTPCPSAPPRLTWNLHQDSASDTERSPDGTRTTKITHRITLTHSHDEHKVNCTAAYRVNGELRKASTTIKLNVTYGPKNTSVVVSPPGPLSAGQSVTLSCSSRAQPPVQRFTWFRRSGSHTPVNVSAGHTYSFNFSLAAHGQYYCEAHSALGKQASQVMLVGPGGVRAAGSSSQTAAIAGGIVSILLVVIVIFAIWKYKSKRKRSQKKRQAAVASGRPQNDAEVHYGQIHFSKPPHESKSSVCDKNQETVYSAVKGSNMAESMALYAP
uniref:Ig-like domain-containing protein n=1 Tax=Knipowitschia caucasica TaxID=637954 RepID=A0AAV2L371_KNICA